MQSGKNQLLPMISILTAIKLHQGIINLPDGRRPWPFLRVASLRKMASAR